MKGKKGYLKRLKPSFQNFDKNQAVKKAKVHPTGISPDEFKKAKSNYRKKRDSFIFKLSRIHKNIQKISDALWGEHYHPFFTDLSRDKYILKSIKTSR